MKNLKKKIYKFSNKTKMKNHITAIIIWKELHEVIDCMSLLLKTSESGKGNFKKTESLCKKIFLMI